MFGILMFIILQLFNQVYPDLVEEFNNAKAAKLSKKSSKYFPDVFNFTLGSIFILLCLILVIIHYQRKKLNKG